MHSRFVIAMSASIAFATAALPLAAGASLSLAVPHGFVRSAPSYGAQADADSINDSLSGLQNPTAAAYVGYALNHQFQPCEGSWPNGIVPTVSMADKFYSGCALLEDPLLTPADIAYILSQIPNWPNLGTRPATR
jgi:hypothetical protein